ncbi:MAG: hypothetical protein RR313_00240 [Anaerovoracaceae bacterium]
MSTKAIIGYIQPDGTVVAGWQWYDGSGLLPALRRHFDTVEKIQELVKNGVWSAIITPRHTPDLSWYQHCSDKYIITKAGKCYIAKKINLNVDFLVEGQDNIKVYKGALIFKNVLTAHGQGAHYFYLFNPKSGKWRTLNAYSYECLKTALSKIKPNDVINHIDNF